MRSPAHAGSPDSEASAISKPSIARSTAMMSTLTMLSRITGFLRIWATAFALGATGLMSAYSVANNIPNMIFELVAGGIISSLFIPMFMELRESNGESEAWRFTSHVFNLAVLCLGVLALIGTLFPEPFIWTQTFRMSPEQAAEVVPAATFFFRFFAIQVVLYGAGSIISGLLNSQRQYFWPAIGPVFNNLVAIGAMLAFVALGGNVTGASLTSGPAPVVLAVGTTLAVLVMFAVQVPAVLRTGWRYSGGLGWRDPAVRRMLVLAVPTVIYVVTNLVAVSFRNASALAVSAKGVSVLTYAWVFYQLPYGILAVALATAVFTELSAASGRKDNEAFKATFAQGLALDRRAHAADVGRHGGARGPARDAVPSRRVQGRRRPARGERPALVGRRTGLLRAHHVPAARLLLAEGHPHAHVGEPRADRRRSDRAVLAALHRNRFVARHRAQRHPHRRRHLLPLRLGHACCPAEAAHRRATMPAASPGRSRA